MVPGSELLPLVREKLARHRAVVIDDPKAATAAVALILAAAPVPSILLIRRAERSGDPWSGHMALPGGYSATSDGHLEATAARETLEETGLDLADGGRAIGSLSDVAPISGLPRVVVRPFVFEVPGVVRSPAGPEVVEALWLPVAELFDPANRKPLTLTFPSGARTFPSIQIGRYTIWGLTERILAEFAAVIGL